MADIFMSVPGQAVLAATATGPQGLMFSLPNQANLGGIVTRLTLSQQVAAQYQPSLDTTFYVTSFGDAPGSMEIGILLNTDCNGTDFVSQFFNYYQNQKLSPDTAGPSSMAIGGSTFLGFATGFTIDGQSAQGQIINGTLRFVVWLALT